MASDAKAAGLQPLAVYIHWPFCRSKCPYCDFNSHVREAIEEERWTRALLTDLERQAELAPDREVASIFFGGGTPSLMAPDTVAALIERVRALWPVMPGLEVTLEANPNSAEAERFAGFATAGVNRLSLGVQALDPPALRFLGRGHSRDGAVAAIALARDIFPRYSFDLIYARPGQSIAAWEDELGEALSLAGTHLSLYQLTIEPGTAFGNRAARGEILTADEDTAAALYEVTQQRRVPETWLVAIEETGSALEEMTPISRDASVEEMLMMGLRLTEGISRLRLEALAQRSIEDLFGPALSRLAEGGFVVLDDERIVATAAGRQRLNAVLAALLA